MTVRNVVTAALFSAASVGTAYAGGLDLSGKPVDLLFAEGNEIRLKFAKLMPSVEGNIDGTGTPFAGLLGDTGNLADDKTTWAFGIKQDINEKFSYSLELDEPMFGAVNYKFASGVPFSAEIKTRSLTALLRYKFTENWSVYGGPRMVEYSSKLNSFGNEFVGDADRDLGYVVGAAFEIPDFKILGALTYSSSTEHQMPSSGFFLPPGAAAPLPISGTTATYSPAQIRLDARSPVNANTLVFGSIRWSEWSKTKVWPGNSNLDGAGTPSLAEWEDTWNYELGVTRLINDSWAVTGILSYEPDNDNPVNFFNAFGGSKGIGVALTHLGDKFTTTLGVNYIKFDDKSGMFNGVLPMTFEDNDAIAVALQTSFKF